MERTEGGKQKPLFKGGCSKGDRAMGLSLEGWVPR